MLAFYGALEIILSSIETFVALVDSLTAFPICLKEKSLLTNKHFPWLF